MNVEKVLTRADVVQKTYFNREIISRSDVLITKEEAFIIRETLYQ